MMGKKLRIGRRQSRCNTWHQALKGRSMKMIFLEQKIIINTFGRRKIFQIQHLKEPRIQG